MLYLDVRGGHVEEWHIPSVQLWGSFLNPRNVFIWECATPLHIHPTSMYVSACDQFYQAIPRVSTASDKH